jgi:hypothetical protein
VLTPSYGLVTGRVSALALDPADPTGNRLYLGTTGGGVWTAQNAAAQDATTIHLTPLTDDLSALSGARDGSISIGALSVQPGGTGVILAGTGDPNDALDSYYGAGILRSADSGNTWKLIPDTSDHLKSFAGEGFAGFAWSTVNPQLVVAAVSQAYEGTLVGAQFSNLSYEGLYYSSDGGVTWQLARITDGGGTDVQGPTDAFDQPDGNAATSVVWNPVRRLFVAAVRFHGYYQSTDGITWTRLVNQPGSTSTIPNLTATYCPTNPTTTGSSDCPIFRGALAVNPLTGDTFAWTVDINNQDVGIWQDQCAVSSNACSNPTITFATQWNTAALELNTTLGQATIENGDYNLTLAAVPSGQDTLLLAGANDLWKCSLAMGCAWRNTTNAGTCMSAQVASYQHALAWNPSNPLEVMVGNDSGLWRSMDAIGETGAACSSTDATHFQNLNGNLGSLAEVVGVSQSTTTPYSMITGLGANGTAGVKGTSISTTAWPQILGGEGGPVAISPGSSPNSNATWYVNNQAGVSILACTQSAVCTPTAFGNSPVVNDSDVGGDGLTMTAPAPFVVDAVDSTQLLIGTCRVWRGSAGGSVWVASNAISPIFGGNTANSSCDGNPLIRSMASMALAGGNEVVYVGMSGAADGGAGLAGHVLAATINSGGNGQPVWQDLTSNPVLNDQLGMNIQGMGISSIFIDPHDASGNTAYVTIEGILTLVQEPQILYGTTDGGAHWTLMSANLPSAQANSVVVDPQDPATVYVATDIGVYFTQQIANCATTDPLCWTAYGTGLPEAPVIQLSAAPEMSSEHVLIAATYGRGVWMIPLRTSTAILTSATMTPASLTFASQIYGTQSKAQAVTLKNTGTSALLPASVTASGDFSETDNCVNASLNAGASCTIQVTFSPTQAGSRTGELDVTANVPGGVLKVTLGGTGTLSGAVVLSPGAVSFGSVGVGVTSPAQPVAAGNSTGTAIPVTSVTITPPFQIASNVCGSSLPGQTDCQIEVDFAPTVTGAVTGTLTMVDGAGTQTVQLTGTGAAVPTDVLSATALAFPGTMTGVVSASQVVSVTNNGDLPLTSIANSVTGAFGVSSTCGTILAGHASCGFTVIFVPTAVGSQTGKLTIADALRTQTVTLSGTGLLPPIFAVSPSSLTFALQQVGASSAPATLTVKNTGGAPMANVGFLVTGTNAGSFLTSGSTCGTSLVNGGACTVQVTFKPVAAGGNAASLAVSSSSIGAKAVSVPLSGAGTGTLVVNPTQLTFPVVSPGQSSAAQTVSLTNTGLVAMNSLQLAATAPFGLVQNACTGTLGAGASCSTGVIFTPSLTGAYTGQVAITSPSLAVATNVLLSGTGGTPGAAQVQPIQLNFPATSVGAASSPITVTVTNPSPVGSLTQLSLAVSAGFQLANNGCPATLAALASCTSNVDFVPATPGAQTGSLTVSSQQLTNGATVALAGMGFDFAVSPSGSASQTVANGQTASYKLSIVPLNGSQGAFTFSCGALPPSAQCIFNPTSVGIPAQGSGFVAVQIATGVTQTSASMKEVKAWRILPLICGLVLLPLGLKRRSLLLIALLAIAMSGVTSCAASGGGLVTPPTPSNPGVTPPATYSIPVSVLSAGITHQVTLTLTVD